MESQHKNPWYRFLLPRKFKEHPGKTGPAVATPHPDARILEWEEKESIKNNYTDGREYFLFAGDIDPQRHQLLVLLKAFSQFKKWQRSDMKLVIAGDTTKRTDGLKEKLATYKYREDVMIIQDPEDLALLKLIAAAYTMIYLDNNDVFSVNIVNAMQSGVPVITCKTPRIEKAMAERGILITPGDHEQLVKNLLLVYKDEAFRTSFIKW